MNERTFWTVLSGLREELGDDRKAAFDNAFLAVRKTPVILYGFSYFLGIFGIDRFILGHVAYGFGKLAVAGLLPLYGALMAAHTYDDAWNVLQLGYIWAIVDLFLIGGATRRWNRTAAMEIKNRLA